MSVKKYQVNPKTIKVRCINSEMSAILQKGTTYTIKPADQSRYGTELCDVRIGNVLYDISRFKVIG